MDDLVVIYRLVDEDTELDLTMVIVMRRKVRIDCIIAGTDSSGMDYRWRSRDPLTIREAIVRLQKNKFIHKELIFDSRSPSTAEDEPEPPNESRETDQPDLSPPSEVACSTAEKEAVNEPAPPADPVGVIDPEQLPY